MAEARVLHSSYQVCSGCESAWRLVTVTRSGVVSRCDSCGDELRVGRAVARIRKASGGSAVLTIPLPTPY